VPNRGALLGGAGLLVLVIGTFLPWLRSGAATRNSYQAGGAVRRLVGASGFIDDLLALWPAIALACALAVALFLVGLRTPAAILAILCALAAGTAAIAALAATATSFVRVALIGPIVTLTGATLVALGALRYALDAVATPRSSR
jgi:hypothetical protein